MIYISTRDSAPRVNFQSALLAGLAPDGGLYVPEAWPRMVPAQLRELAGARYPDVAAATMAPFTTGFLAQDELAQMAEDAYAAFGHADVAPLRPLTEGVSLLELFWGPTLAFKDMAMQMLARMLDRALDESGRRATIIGATSGDTGSAAIEAFRDRANLDVVILYPDGRVSEVQRRQMTTVDASNVHPIAVDGTFDDCQDMVKALFADQAVRDRFGLSTANSINWGRIVAQIPYYVWAATRPPMVGQPVVFSVPSGNFGNVFSGYAAWRMGLPVRRLLVGSNANHVLATFFERGRLRLGPVVPTLAPSMDIQIPSNLERLLFDLLERDGQAVAAAIGQLRQSGSWQIDQTALVSAQELFDSRWLGDEEIRRVMYRVFVDFGLLIDPHTAVGVDAAMAYGERPVVAVATAHPAKFPDAVTEATGTHPPLPEHLGDLFTRPERMARVPANVDAVRDYLERSVRPAR